MRAREINGVNYEWAGAIEPIELHAKPIPWAHARADAAHCERVEGIMGWGPYVSVYRVEFTRPCSGCHKKVHYYIVDE